ncbi:MAG: sigma-54-dependent Fis family transcriptional regulator [Rhodothermales bacterium]|nr:sigma-54-dependent Fis family transcriptional regulator [Rhodothermales bacterium]
MTQSFGKVLIVDDDADVLQALRLLLKKHANVVDVEKRPEMLPTILRNESYDIILLDMNFTQDVTSGREGFYWIDKILSIDPSAVVILITAYGDVSTAVQAIKAGATDFVLKPWQNERLLATMASAVKLRMTEEEASRLRSGQMLLSADMDNKFQDFVGGRAASMQRVFETINKVARTDANVLILGENGTGKELVARELHRQSARSGEVFVTVDMGAIVESLFESELFGHVKGSFTGANDHRAGRFEVATRGTLFLDEIGNLSLPLQAKLLTVLQQREVIRVGANKARPIDVRLICATNMPIYDMVGEHSFRQDLLYRVNTVEIKLPPLRERVEDIEELVKHFLGIYAEKYQKNIHGIRPAALRKLEKYAWPGNVRELQHMIERAIIMTDSNMLQPEDFLFAASMNGDQQDSGFTFDSYNLEEVERLVIRRALAKEDGNISRAAEELGLTRASLYRRLEKYGL